MDEAEESKPRRCPECGAEFSGARTPMGLCPACLMRLGSSDPAMPMPTASPDSKPESPPEPGPEPAQTVLPPRPTSMASARVLTVVAGALVALAALFLFLYFLFPAGNGDRDILYSRVVRFDLTPPNETELPGGAQFAVSPDGARVVVTARGGDGQSRLWVRALESPQWRELAGTEGAAFPFWSPDSQYAAFFAGGRLKTVNVANGLTQNVCAAPAGRGGTWSYEGAIVFAGASGALMMVPESGGTPTQVTTLDGSRGEIAHRWPHFLPDGRRFLFVVDSGSNREGSPTGVYVTSLESGSRMRIEGAGDGPAMFVNGYLLSLRGATLVAGRFDFERGLLTSEWHTVAGADPIDAPPGTGAAFSASQNGVLAYKNGSPDLSTFSWLDRSGRHLRNDETPASYQGFAVAPDGRSIVAARHDEPGRRSNLWLIDVTRGVTSRVTLGSSQDSSPVWSPDGRRVAFASLRDRERGGEIYVTEAGAGGREERVFGSPESLRPILTDWSTDGRFLLYTARSARTGADVWALPLSGDRASAGSGRPELAEGRKPYPLVQTPADETDGRLSPDGRWVAYVSDESGRDEVYVRAFPQPERRWQISADGGAQPRWRRDGRELFFVANRLLMGVDVEGGVDFQAGVARPLFEMPGSDFDLTGDGRVVVKVPLREPGTNDLHVILNWTAEIGPSR